MSVMTFFSCLSNFPLSLSSSLRVEGERRKRRRGKGRKEERERRGKGRKEERERRGKGRKEERERKEERGRNDSSNVTIVNILTKDSEYIAIFILYMILWSSSSQT